MAEPVRRRPRVTVSLPAEALAVWRECAQVSDMPLSQLLGQYMEELAPALVELTRLRRAYKAADAAQQAALREAVAQAATVGEATLREGWAPMQEVLGGLDDVE